MQGEAKTKRESDRRMILNSREVDFRGQGPPRKTKGVKALCINFAAKTPE